MAENKLKTAAVNTFLKNMFFRIEVSSAETVINAPLISHTPIGEQRRHFSNCVDALIKRTKVFLKTHLIFLPLE